MVKKILLELLNLNSEEDYVEYFFRTLLLTNKTYEYFVDWDKVYRHVKKYLTEIHILNSITKLETEKERIEHFKLLIKKYPETLPVIPIMIAVRDEKITILDSIERGRYIYKDIDFSSRVRTDKEIDQIVKFCIEAGITKLFSEISDLYTYLLGMEVGIDTNSRKNRSGIIFEKLVYRLLKNVVSQIRGIGKDVKLVYQDSKIKIRRNKNVDFSIYVDEAPVIAIETNFYNVSGSKPIEVAESYIKLQSRFNKNNITFIWITDGRGWLSSKGTIKQSFSELHFPMNYYIAQQTIKNLVVKKL